MLSMLVYGLSFLTTRWADTIFNPIPEMRTSRPSSQETHEAGNGRTRTERRQSALELTRATTDYDTKPPQAKSEVWALKDLCVNKPDHLP